MLHRLKGSTGATPGYHVADNPPANTIDMPGDSDPPLPLCPVSRLEFPGACVANLRSPPNRHTVWKPS